MKPVKFHDFDENGNRKGGRPRGIDPRPPEDRPVVWDQLYAALMRLVCGLGSADDLAALQDLKQLAAAVEMQCKMQREWSRDSRPSVAKLQHQNGAAGRAYRAQHAHDDLLVGAREIEAAARAVREACDLRDADELQEQRDVLRDLLDRLQLYMRSVSGWAPPVQTEWSEDVGADDLEAEQQRDRETTERLWYTVPMRALPAHGGRVGPKKGADGW